MEAGRGDPMNAIRAIRGLLEKLGAEVEDYRRKSCHIEAYNRPEKYCFVLAGPLANHHSILTSFFTATAERRRRKEQYVLPIWTANFRSHSAAPDGRRAAKLA